MTKRYRLLHRFTDGTSDCHKDDYEVETLAEARDLEAELRGSVYDSFSLYDTMSDTPPENVWWMVEHLKGEGKVESISDLLFAALKPPTPEQMASWRKPPTNPATHALLDSISAENIRAALSTTDI